jgi:hypothetical protein
MKIPRFTLAALLGLALAGTASAQSTLRIIGATAYRAPVHAAIEQILEPGYAFAVASSGTSPSSIGGANAAYFEGNLVSNGDPVVIKTYFTGAVSGVADLASGRAITGFIADGYATASGTALGSSGYPQEPAHSADVAWSDEGTAQDALALQLGNSGAKTAKSTIQGTTFVEAGTQGQNSITGQGIVPFQWVLESTGAVPAPITGINQQNAATLIKDGSLPLIAITGSSANQYDYLFLVGRNEDAGVRVNVFAEAQTGFGQVAIQWMPSFTGVSGSYQDLGASSSYITSSGTNYVYDGGPAATLSGLQKWPGGWALNTNTAISWAGTGHSGFVTGSELASVLESIDPITSGGISIVNGPTSPGNVYVIGYLAPTDATTAETTGTSASNHGATPLTYNGVAYSQANVENGSYSLWGYEHSVYLTTLGGDQQVAANNIADTVYLTTASYSSALVSSTTTAAAGIIENSSVLFQRTAPGGVITQRY